MSKYIKFEKIGTTKSGKTHIWDIVSKTSQHSLGIIKWYAPWRQYCLFTNPKIIFNAECLCDVIKFIKEIKK